MAAIDLFKQLVKFSGNCFGEKILITAVFKKGVEMSENFTPKSSHKNICKNWRQRVAHAIAIYYFVSLSIKCESCFPEAHLGIV